MMHQMFMIKLEADVKQRGSDANGSIWVGLIRAIQRKCNVNIFQPHLLIWSTAFSLTEVKQKRVRIP